MSAVVVYFRRKGPSDDKPEQSKRHEYESTEDAALDLVRTYGEGPVFDLYTRTPLGEITWITDVLGFKIERGS